MPSAVIMSEQNVDLVQNTVQFKAKLGRHRDKAFLSSVFQK